MRVPDYYDRFRCKGGKCLDSCCIGWEIEIDDKSLEFYNSVKGDFGKRLRQNITADNSFSLINERCAFLNDDNLCDIYTNLGEDRLCTVCSEHPRFFEDIGGIRESGLGLSCEAACELIFNSRDKFHLTGDFSSDDVLSCHLFWARDVIFEILSDRNCDIAFRIAKMLKFAEQIQQQADRGVLERIPVPEINEYEKQNLDYDAVFLRLEFMGTEMQELLNSPKACVKLKEYEYEALVSYFIFRYFMKSSFDLDVLSKVKLAAVSYIMVRRMDMAVFYKKGIFGLYDRIYTAKLYSKEVEYSQENLDFLYNEFLINDMFSVENIISML